MCVDMCICILSYLTRYRTVQEPLVECSTIYLTLLVSRSLLLVHVCCLLTFASSSAHTAPHAVSGTDSAALLPAVVALALALLTALLLLVAAVLTAILFYTSESMHYCIDSECECTCLLCTHTHGMTKHTGMCFSTGRATQLKAGTNVMALIVCTHEMLTACTQRYALVQVDTTHSWD